MTRLLLIGLLLFHAAWAQTKPVTIFVCGELELFGDQPDVVLNPLLIVEVLSRSTEGCDRGKKFERYRAMPSFREYLLVHQDRRHGEHYSKQDDGSWLLRVRLGLYYSALDLPPLT